MKANTAIGFVLSGIALWLSNLADANLQTRRGAIVLSGVVAALGLITLSQDFFGLEFGIDQLFFKDALSTALHLGWMSPITALCFFLFGLAVISLNMDVLQTWLPQSFTLTATALSFIALLGYEYNIRSRYQVGPYSPISVHDAISFIILGCGILYVCPTHGLLQVINSDTLGGTNRRRVLPFVMVVPVVLGWLRLLGHDE